MGAEIRQLPRGRHRLSRQEVLSSQRGRMLAAVAEATAEKGFARVTVADVISRAGVSRETFYEHFADKEDCFLNLLDDRVERLLEVLGQALGPRVTGSALERLDRVLDSYLTALAAEPVFAKAYLIDAYGAGPRAVHERIELQKRFVEMVADAVGVQAGVPSGDLFACEALVAAISSLVTARVGDGRAAELPELREPIISLVARMLPAAGETTTRRRAAR